MIKKKDSIREKNNNQKNENKQDNTVNDIQDLLNSDLDDFNSAQMRHNNE